MDRAFDIELEDYERDDIDDELEDEELDELEQNFDFLDH